MSDLKESGHIEARQTFTHALGYGFCFGPQRRCRRLWQEEADVGMKRKRPDPAVAAEKRNCSMSTQSEWLTATEAASYLRIKPRTILLWARQGHIRGHILSGTRRVTWRFLRSDLDATLTPPSVALTKRRIL